jgi:AraC-like DNA-binding protein
MIHWLKTPKSLDVAKYIECYWLLERTADAAGDKYPRLNPDPCAHFILSPANQTFKYTINNKIHQGKGSHLLYPYCKTLQLDHSKPLICLGIKFRVGALYSLAHNNAALPLLDTVNEMSNDQIQNSVQGANQINEILAIAKTQPDKCCDKLDELLMPWLLKYVEDRHSELTRKILPLLANNPINKLSELLNCSQRTLERSFLKVTGISLKQCQSMNKLEQILEYLYQRDKSDIDWVDVAYQFGFSDQPHLIRYLKKQIDLTPKDYAQQRGLAIDVYGGVSSQ